MKITRKEFRDWLVSKKRMHFVAMAPCLCPIAAYLQEQYGCPVTVLSTCAYSGAAAMIWLPQWAHQFIAAFDAYAERHGVQILTATRAVIILDSI